jgi:transcriptional regulator of heat shock response
VKNLCRLKIFNLMNSRQQKILSAIIEEYTKTAIPAGSQILVDHYDFKVSPATIRNDMTKLEKEGYLYQPHISAGRIPTDKGYRYFVEEIMRDKELSKSEQQKMQREFLKLKAQNMRLTKTTAKLLSHLSGNFAISGLISSEEFADFGMRELVRQPEFKELDEMCRLVEVLDYLDERFDKIVKGIKENETKIFIGNENPIGISNCSMIISPYKLKSGEKGILALIGPKRMKYAKNKSMIEYMKKLLGASAVIILFVQIAKF